MSEDRGSSAVSRREDGSGGAVVKTGGTAAEAQASKQQALVQARIIQAIQRPRDMEDVRVRLLAECKRPGFAAVARYKVPNRGEGPSIRFAEAAIRSMGNLSIDITTTYDDDEKRILHVAATDLETNATYEKDVTIAKTVERSNADGRMVLDTRRNSNGRATYVVRCTDEELTGKENATVSKALRVLALRHLPGDILEECMDAVQVTARKRDAEDPQAALRKVVDGFAYLKVKPSALAKYLGHPVDQCTPAEISDLRDLWNALKDGQQSWAQALADKLAEGREEGDDGGTNDTPRGGLDRLGAALSATKAAPQDFDDDEPLPSLGEVAERAAADLDAMKGGDA